MRFKQKAALLLSGIMLAGSIEVMNPVEVKAAATNTFTLTVPADMSITRAGWNSIGEVKVTGDIDAAKKVTVTITTENDSKLVSGSNEISYTIKKAVGDESAATRIDFDAAEINGSTAKQEIGADVSDYSDKAYGTYTDTINFTAELKDPGVEYILTGSKAGGKELTSAALLASKTTDASTYSTLTYDGKQYIAYNAFISETAGATFEDAQTFVEKLNEVELNGWTGGWTLLTDENMAFEWWQSTAVEENDTNYSGVKFAQREFGNVSSVWSGLSYSDKEAHYWGCWGAYNSVSNGDNKKGVQTMAWNRVIKGASVKSYGFVVLRGSSNAPAPTAVTYNKTDSTGTLSSADLGEPTSWEYDTTTYQVYNAFIPSSWGSSWNDAKGFIKALNDANYGGHSDWTLLSSEEMAEAYADSVTGVMPDSSDLGGVGFLWSSVEDPLDTGKAYGLYCISVDWDMENKSDASSNYGFVVLRGSSDV